MGGAMGNGVLIAADRGVSLALATIVVGANA